MWARILIPEGLMSVEMVYGADRRQHGTQWKAFWAQGLVR